MIRDPGAEKRRHQDLLDRQTKESKIRNSSDCAPHIECRYRNVALLTKHLDIEIDEILETVDHGLYNNDDMEVNMDATGCISWTTASFKSALPS